MAFALITGASRGIGRSLAEELARRKTDLLLVSRSEGELRELCATLARQEGIRAFSLPLDLAVPGAAVQVRQWCETNGYDVSVLINNAGFGLWGPFGELSLDSQRGMMQLNVVLPVELTHEMLPLLRTQPQAYVMNVASTAAYQPVPRLSVYAATKAFVLLFSRGLRYELRGSNVAVSCLLPGATTTDFLERAGMLPLKARAALFSMPPERVARAAVRGMYRKKAEIVPGFLNQLGAVFAPALPTSLVEAAAAAFHADPGERRAVGSKA